MLFVFDLDGTLIDSRRDLTDASNDLLAAHGAPPLDEEAVGSMVGEGAATLVRRVLAARQLDVPQALQEFLELYDRRLLNHTRPYEGIPRALAQLGQHGSLAVLTNKPLGATERILHALGLREQFEWVVGGDGPHGRKPRPQGLRDLMTLSGESPDQTVLIGDSRVDLETARNAGTRICLARYGFGFCNCPPSALRGDELFVDRPDDLAARLLPLAHLAKGSS
jgi:phosphoglycolate phosphatase